MVDSVFNSILPLPSFHYPSFHMRRGIVLIQSAWTSPAVLQTELVWHQQAAEILIFAFLSCFSPSCLYHAGAWRSHESEPLRRAACTRLPSRGERDSAGSTGHLLDGEDIQKAQLRSGNQSRALHLGQGGGLKGVRSHFQEPEGLNQTLAPESLLMTFQIISSSKICK